MLISILSVAAILWITSKDINPSYKLAWTTLILALPIVGAVIYLLFGKTWLGKETQQKLDAAAKEAADHIGTDEEAREHLEEQSKAAARQSAYISDVAGFPLHAAGARAGGAFHFHGIFYYRRR